MSKKQQFRADRLYFKASESIHILVYGSLSQLCVVVEVDSCSLWWEVNCFLDRNRYRWKVLPYAISCFNICLQRHLVFCTHSPHTSPSQWRGNPSAKTGTCSRGDIFLGWRETAALSETSLHGCFLYLVRLALTIDFQ